MTWSVPVYLCTESVFQCFRMNYQKWKYMGLGNIFRAFSTYCPLLLRKDVGRTLILYSVGRISSILPQSLPSPPLSVVLLFFLKFFWLASTCMEGRYMGKIIILPTSVSWAQGSLPRRNLLSYFMCPSRDNLYVDKHACVCICITMGLPRWLSRWTICLPVQETQETWVPSVGQEDPLQEEMATHPSVLVWNILWTAAKSLQSCLTLSDPIDGSPLGSSVPGILQARILEWVAISFSNAWKWKVKMKSLSCPWLLATPRTAAYQALPSMGFSRQEYWSGVPLPSPTVDRGWAIVHGVAKSRTWLSD